MARFLNYERYLEQLEGGDVVMRECRECGAEWGEVGKACDDDECPECGSWDVKETTSEELQESKRENGERESD